MSMANCAVVVVPVLPSWSLPVPVTVYTRFVKLVAHSGIPAAVVGLSTTAVAPQPLYVHAFAKVAVLVPTPLSVVVVLVAKLNGDAITPENHAPLATPAMATVGLA